MILSSPFSRQNRNFQTWTNGTSSPAANNTNTNRTVTNFNNQKINLNKLNSLKKPAPEQPAPAKPTIQPPATNSMLNEKDAANFRSHTLNRLDLHRRRQQQQQQQQELDKNDPSRSSQLRRNLSSLGHYPDSFHQGRQDLYSSPAHTATSQIYAPASIAGTSDLNRYRHPASSSSSPPSSITYPKATNCESQHYAATSLRATSESGGARSGRESALGHLLERFGTLRRRTKWLRRSKTAPQMVGNPPSAINSPSTLQPDKVVTLDPEIYATGKREVEADAIYAEGLSAIDGNCQKRLLQYELNEAIMSEGETRTLIVGLEETQSNANQANYRALLDTLTNWINDELSQQRIIVRDLQEDLYDGQILGKLIEKLENTQLDIVEVTQNEISQKIKLRHVLDTINRILSLQAKWARIRWSVEGIHGKNMVEIVQLLVTLAIYYGAPIKLPPNVRVTVLVVQKSLGQLVKRSHEVQLTDSLGQHYHHQSSAVNSKNSPAATPNVMGANDRGRDAFDALLEFAPEKLEIVKRSLVNFVNRHLNKINISCLAANTIQENQVLNPEQFSDGLILVFLISSLEDYFVPLGNLFTVAPPSPKSIGKSILNHHQLLDVNNNDKDEETQITMVETALEPNSYINTLPIHKLHNVNVALQLIEEAGIPIREQIRPEDIVNGDLKSVLRVLYVLFSRYKHL